MLYVYFLELNTVILRIIHRIRSFCSLRSKLTREKGVFFLETNKKWPYGQAGHSKISLPYRLVCSSKTWCVTFPSYPTSRTPDIQRKGLTIVTAPHTTQHTALCLFTRPLSLFKRCTIATDTTIDPSFGVVITISHWYSSIQIIFHNTIQ